jgi:hypothetical protein
LFLGKLRAAHQAGGLAFFGDHVALAEPRAFAAFLAPLRKIEWVVYGKKPFGGPQAVLAYLSRYTHRVAISNRRLISADKTGVTFKWKDYRIEGPDRDKTMTLPTGEFIRRFLTHVLPKGLHRIRHYGLFANGHRAANIARARELLAVPSRPKPAETSATTAADEPRVLSRPCHCCGGRMIIIETFAAAASRNTAPRPLPQRSASTPHDAVATDPPTQRRSSFRLAPGRSSPRLLRVPKSARSHTANLVGQRPLRSFSPSLIPILRGKAIGAGASIQPRPT